MNKWRSKPKGPWIDVEDYFPKINQRVLVYSKEGVHGGNEIEIEYLEDEETWSNQGIVSNITHWMILPNIPN